MLKFFKKIIGDKKEYREQLARVALLPDDYQQVFKRIHDYIWNFAGGDGSDMLKTQQDLISLFETSVADGLRVLDVTGEDLAGFCDELIRDTQKWTDRYREKLNRPK